MEQVCCVAVAQPDDLAPAGYLAVPRADDQSGPVAPPDGYLALVDSAGCTAGVDSVQVDYSVAP